MSAQQDLGKPPPRWVLKLYTRINVWVYHWSKGKYMNTLEGKPICLVTMTGAKSGRERTIPLMYVPYENGFVLVASQGGAPNNPVWYYNLKKNPQITIEYHGVAYRMLARQVEGEEKARIWPTCLAYWPDFGLYQQRTGRNIPVFLCEPR